MRSMSSSRAVGFGVASVSGCSCGAASPVVGAMTAGGCGCCGCCGIAPMLIFSPISTSSLSLAFGVSPFCASFSSSFFKFISSHAACMCTIPSYYQFSEHARLVDRCTVVRKMRKRKIEKHTFLALTFFPLPTLLSTLVAVRSKTFSARSAPFSCLSRCARDLTFLFFVFFVMPEL